MNIDQYTTLLMALDKKKLADNSKIAYIKCMKEFLTKMDKRDIIELVRDHSSMVIDYIKKMKKNDNTDYSLETKKQYFCAIDSLFKHLQTSIQPSIGLLYKEALTTLKAECTQYSASKPPHKNISSTSEDGTVTIVPWENLVNLNTLFKDDKYGSKDHMIIAMYTLMEPRRGAEYASLILVEKEPTTLTPDANYIFPDVDLNYSMIIQSHKAVKSLNTFKTQLVPELNKVVTAYVNKNKINTNEGVFLPKTDNKRYSESAFLTLIEKTFLQYFKSKLTINNIRHIHDSMVRNNPNLSIASKMKIADNMGHSLYQQSLYAQAPTPLTDEQVAQLYIPQAVVQPVVEPEVEPEVEPVVEPEKEKLHAFPAWTYHEDYPVLVVFKDPVSPAGKLDIYLECRASIEHDYAKEKALLQQEMDFLENRYKESKEELKMAYMDSLERL